MPTDYAQAINELADECSEVTESKDFNIFPALSQTFLKVALISTEVSEALAVHRDEYTDTDLDVLSQMTEMQEQDFTEELADVIIRTLDLAGYLELDLGTAVVHKIEKNKGRPQRHGKRY